MRELTFEEIETVAGGFPIDIEVVVGTFPIDIEV